MSFASARAGLSLDVRLVGYTIPDRLESPDVMEAGRVADDQEHTRIRRRTFGVKKRNICKEPISARLVLDSHIQGDVGVLSSDLVADLCLAANVEGMLKMEFGECLLAVGFNRKDNLNPKG